MQANECCFVIYESYFGIATKVEWNQKGGYVPDHQSTQEFQTMLAAISPDFREEAESMFKYKQGYKKYQKEAKDLLLAAGMVEVDFGQKV